MICTETFARRMHVGANQKDALYSPEFCWAC